MLLDGVDIRDMTLDSLSKQMSIVPQEPYLFSGTIRENIRYSHTDASDEDIVRAATAVGAHDFIMKMENGYDTPCRRGAATSASGSGSSSASPAPWSPTRACCS